MTLELSYDSFSDTGLASGDPDGRPSRPDRHVRLEHGDVVYLDERPGPEGGPVRFAIDARPGLRGPKRLRFVHRDGRVLGEAESGEFAVARADLPGGRLVFSTGAHDTYHLDTSTIPGRTVDTGRAGEQPVGELRFYWSRDSR